MTPFQSGWRYTGIIVRVSASADRDAGSRTMFSYVKMFVDAGLQVAFWPDNLYRDRAYIRALQDIGVEVVYGGPVAGRFAEWIKQRGPYIDYVFLSRAHVAERLAADLRTYCSAKLLYYGHDLTYERLEREYKLTGLAQTLTEIEEWREREQAIWQQSRSPWEGAPFLTAGPLAPA